MGKSGWAITRLKKDIALLWNSVGNAHFQLAGFFKRPSLGFCCDFWRDFDHDRAITSKLSSARIPFPKLRPM